jgi:HTH-type transcriptional regulator/antitoxin HigA
MSGSEYRNLMAERQPRPIRDAQAAADVQAQIDALLAAGTLSPAEEEYLELLTDLLRVWEEDNVVMPRVSGVEMIKFLLEARGEPQRALVPIFGTPSIVSEVLAGKRELRSAHIEQLAAYFYVSPEVFFPLHQAAAA